MIQLCPTIRIAVLIVRLLWRSDVRQSSSGLGTQFPRCWEEGPTASEGSWYCHWIKKFTRAKLTGITPWIKEAGCHAFNCLSRVGTPSRTASRIVPHSIDNLNFALIFLPVSIIYTQTNKSSLATGTSWGRWIGSVAILTAGRFTAIESRETRFAGSLIRVSCSRSCGICHIDSHQRSVHHDLMHRMDSNNWGPISTTQKYRLHAFLLARPSLRRHVQKRRGWFDAVSGSQTRYASVGAAEWRMDDMCPSRLKVTCARIRLRWTVDHVTGMRSNAAWQVRTQMTFYLAWPTEPCFRAETGRYASSNDAVLAAWPLHHWTTRGFKSPSPCHTNYEMITWHHAIADRIELMWNVRTLGLWSELSSVHTLKCGYERLSSLI
jgi:hypothetical protein